MTTLDVVPTMVGMAATVAQVAVEKLSISMDAEVAQAIREEAQAEDLTVSRWIAEAAQARLRKTALKRYLDEYQAEHGAFTQEEMDEAADELGLPRIPWP